jgi:hypothetical protein
LHVCAAESRRRQLGAGTHALSPALLSEADYIAAQDVNAARNLLHRTDPGGANRLAVGEGVSVMTANPGATGNDIAAYEPGLGTAKRPDYLIRAAGQEAVIEVQSFNTSPMPAMLSRVDLGP